jgi:hypothetical protein
MQRGQHVSQLLTELPSSLLTRVIDVTPTVTTIVNIVIPISCMIIMIAHSLYVWK